QRLVAAEDEEIVALIGAPILGVAGDSGAKAGPAQRVGRPARLPRRQKVARARPEAGPFLVVATLRRAQVNPVAGQPERLRAGQKQAGKGFALRGHGFSAAPLIGQRISWRGAPSGARN